MDLPRGAPDCSPRRLRDRCAGAAGGHSPASVEADGTEGLGAPSISVATGSGIVAAGIGLETQPGTIDVNVPGTVRQALLYTEGQTWLSPGATMDVTVNGAPVTMSRIGGPTWFYSIPVDGVWRDIVSLTYRADITSLVSSGANSLVVDGLDFNYVNDGAGVLVIYDDGTTSQIDVRDGNDSAFINFSYLHGIAPVDVHLPGAGLGADGKPVDVLRQRRGPGHRRTAPERRARHDGRDHHRVR